MMKNFNSMTSHDL